MSNGSQSVSVEILDDGKPNKGGRPLKYSSPKKLQQAVDKYFETERYPTVTGLQLYLDMTSATMSDYKKRDGFSSIIETAGRRVAKKYEERLIYGNGRNTAGIIFALKVGMGWREHAEEVETVQSTIQDNFREKIQEVNRLYLKKK